MASEFESVYLHIKGKGQGYPKIRDLIFMHKGTSIRLKQRLLSCSDGSIIYMADILPSSDCSVCGSNPVDWANDICIALQNARDFEEKSRPHWEKHCKNEDPLGNLFIDIDIHYPDKFENKLDNIAKELEDELEKYIIDKLNSVLDTNFDMENNPVLVQLRKRRVR